MKVYVVTRGEEYGGSDVEAIFTVEKDAKEYVEAMLLLDEYDSINPHVDTYELDTVKAPSEAVGVYFIGDGSFYFEEFFEGDKGYRCVDGEFFCVVPFNLNKRIMEQSVRDLYKEWRNSVTVDEMLECSKDKGDH